MASRGMDFIRHDYAFKSIANPKKARRPADGFAGLPWGRLLDHATVNFGAADMHVTEQESNPPSPARRPHG